jgi:cellulose synthase/poly-beta-1,6-N-acetylglucosamine synthase-like glycosyltransferase
VPTLSAVVPATDSPPTLAACLAAIGAADDPPEEVIAVTEGGLAGAARNDGARRATQDVIVFVDADVLPHPDAFRRIRDAFDADPDLAALFGSYDDAPADPGVVSGFRNLLHHHVHHGSPGRATTFWTGLGAVRRDVFASVGGFDPAWPLMEDVELGMRITESGRTILLDPSIQGTHLKRWTVASMLQTDIVKRGVPWVELLLADRERERPLNLEHRHRLSALASVGATVALLRGRPRGLLLCLGTLVALNASFYRLLARRRGPRQAAAGVALHALHHLAGVVCVPLGVAAHLRRRLG